MAGNKKKCFQYRVFIKYCVFSLKCCDFPVLLQRWCSTCLACVHTDTEGKQRKTRVRNILTSLEKTRYLMNTLYQGSIIQLKILQSICIKKPGEPANKRQHVITKVIQMYVHAYNSRWKISTWYLRKRALKKQRSLKAS